METLDKDIVNLAKAIRTVESGGNLNARGASGEVSAYQFMPTTWKLYAGQILGDENAPMTLQNQNQVVYKKIKGWKDQGFNIGQIASMWNAGEQKANAYKENWKGVNDKGISFDTPAYAKNVATEYQKLKALTPIESTLPSDKPFDKTVNLEELGEGVAKSIGKTVFGGAELLQSGGQKFLSMITPGMSFEDVKAKTGFDFLKEGTESNTNINEALKYDNLGEMIGGYGTDVATFFIPGTGTVKGAVAIKGLKGLEAAKVASEAKTVKGLFTTTNAVKIALNSAPDAAIAASQAKGAGATDQEAIATGFITGLLSGGINLAGSAIKANKAAKVLTKKKSILKDAVNAAKPGGTLFQKEARVEATGWLNNTIKKLTEKGLGATASDISKGRVPSYDFIKTTDLAFGLGKREAIATNNIEKISGSIDNLLDASGREVDKGIYAVIANRAKNLIKKDYELVAKPSEIDELLVKTMDKYAWKLSDPLIGNATGISMKELNKVRKAIDNVIKETTFERVIVKGEEGALKELDVLRKIRESMADVVKEVVPETKVMFKELQNWIKVKKLSEKAIDKASSKYGIGFYDSIAGIGGLITGGPVAAVGALVGKRILMSSETPLTIARLLKKLPSEKATKLFELISDVPDTAPASVVKSVIMNFIQDELTDEEKLSINN